MSELVESVHALADGELNEVEKAKVSEALASNPKLSNEYEWAKLFKSELKQKCPPIQEQEVWQQCRSRIVAIDKVSKTQFFVNRFSWAFCLVFLVGLFSAATLNRIGGSRPLTNDHVAGLLNGLTPFTFSEPKDAMVSVKSRVGLVPGQLADVARVINVSMGTVDGRKAARMTIDDGQGPVNLFVIAGTSGIESLGAIDSGYNCGNINDNVAVSWTDRGYLCLLIGSRNEEELKHLADLIRAKN